jgi:dolichol-phosphate mannosyltransferase
VEPATSPRVSLISPAFNEAENLDALHERICVAMEEAGTWEWIIVDDHSGDRTFATIEAIAARDCRTRGVRLSRNFGSHAAILCGLTEARGEAAVVFASDGQDPPEAIPRLLAAWRSGAVVVWAEQEDDRPQPIADRIASRLFHGLLRRLSGMDALPAAGSDCFLVGRPAIDLVKALGERNTNAMALLAWLGFDQARIGYKKSPRARGASGWTLGKKLKLAIDSVTGFSVRPLQFISAFGMLVALLGFVYAVVVVVNALLGRPIEGWSSLMVAVLLIGGVQMLMLGVLGEYLWRALDESRGRPRYVIERRTR